MIINDEDRAVVRKAIDILQTEGWTKGYYRDNFGYCAIGALTAAWGGEAPTISDEGWCPDIRLTERSNLVRAMDARAAQLQHKTDPDWSYCGIADFNDDAKTVDEVIDLLMEFA